MIQKEHQPNSGGAWRSIHAAVWLIGMAILAWQDWWWPGILVLVAISMLIEAKMKRNASQADQKIGQPESPGVQPAAPIQAAPIVNHPLELLPSECPRCGAPVRSHEVKWSGPRSADCSYCGGNLPLLKSEKG